MKRILLFVLLGVALLSLWGCNSATQSQNHETTEQATSKKRPFITKWQGKAGEELSIPILGTYTLTWYNEATPNERHTEQVTVKTGGEEWEEEERLIEYVIPHTFVTPTDGVYVVEAGPEGVEGILMTSSTEKTPAPALLSVVQFGDVVWKKLNRAFYGCNNLQFEKDIDAPNLSQCTTLTEMFMECERFNSPLEHWDVSTVTDMNGMFYECLSFNQPLNGWKVGKVQDFSSMFLCCSQFNQPLEQWDVSQAINMNNMFLGCRVFNQPLEKWDVSQVRSMAGMFSNCRAFNQPLERWNVSNVSDMGNIFENCPAGKLPFVEKWKSAGHYLGE